MLTSKLGRIFVGETERPIPVLKNDYQCNCALRHKVGEIDPWVRAAFLCLHFRFVLYMHKAVGAKAACRMLVKLTPGLR
jgi:hypothetical protein